MRFLLRCESPERNTARTNHSLDEKALPYLSLLEIKSHRITSRWRFESIHPRFGSVNTIHNCHFPASSLCVEFVLCCVLFDLIVDVLTFALRESVLCLLGLFGAIDRHHGAFNVVEFTVPNTFACWLCWPVSVSVSTGKRRSSS